MNASGAGGPGVEREPVGGGGGGGRERFDAVGVVLGAGAATRYGSPKQLADFRGAPLISWPIRALAGGGLERIVVVLGAHAEAIRPMLAPAPGTDLEIVVVSDWSDGLSASLRAGVAAAADRGAERAVIVLADQPLISAEAVARVLAASRGGAAIARASYAGRPGHPVALDATTFAAVAALPGDTGARGLIDAPGERGLPAVTGPCDGLGSPADVDTPADLVRLSAADLTFPG